MFIFMTKYLIVSFYKYFNFSNKLAVVRKGKFGNKAKNFFRKKFKCKFPLGIIHRNLCFNAGCLYI